MSAPRYSPHYSIFGQEAHLEEPRFFHVERISSRLALHDRLVQRHSHPHLHQLSFWLHGSGTYHMEDESHALETNAVTWMPSGTIHGFDALAPSDAIVLSMADDFVREQLRSIGGARLLNLLSRPAIHRAEADEAGELNMLFTGLEREYALNDWGQADAIGARARLIMIMLVRLATRDHAATDGLVSGSALMPRFLNLIEEHLSDRLTVAGYAGKLGTTPYLLNRASRIEMGMRASELVRARQMQEARRLLLFTTMAVAEVGARIGYEDPSHFTRAFTRHVGQTPRLWREERMKVSP